MKSAATTTRSSSRNVERSFPDTAEVAEGPRREYHRLCQLDGYHGILTLCREGRLYNYCLKRAGTLERGTSGTESRHRDERTRKILLHLRRETPRRHRSCEARKTSRSAGPRAERLQGLSRGTWGENEAADARPAELLVGNEDGDNFTISNPWMSSATIANRKDMSPKYTKHWDLPQQEPRRIHLRGVWLIPKHS